MKTNMDDIEVTLMLAGGKDSGKTIAVNCSYGMMSSGDVTGGFVLAMDGLEALRDSGELLDNYIRMQTQEKLPNSTMENNIYSFAFQEANETICKIKWFDYKGALLTSKGLPEEREALEVMMKNTAILTYIVSGDVLNAYIKLRDNLYTDKIEKIKADGKVKKVVQEIRTLLQYALTVREDLPPILFYVTKSDYIKLDNGNKEQGIEKDAKKMEALKSFIFKNNFFKFNDGEYQWKILGSHSTLGRNVVLNDENAIVTGFEPEGFEIPLMLTVGYRLSEAGKKWAEKEVLILEQSIDEIEYSLRGDETRLDAVGSKFGEKFVNAFFGKTRKQQNEEQKLKGEIEKKKQEKKSLQLKMDNAQNNTMKKYSDKILDYIEEKGANTVFYINSEGKERPIKEFFQ